MPHSNKSRPEAQEMFVFDGPLTLPDTYDIQRARAAAQRRHSRIGNVTRIVGFRRRVDGLFVPHSGTENSAVVEMPEIKAEKERKSAAQRVYEKYESNSDVSTRQVDLWAHFAAQNAHRAIRQKYRKFRDNSLVDAARIGMQVATNDGVIGRSLFVYDPEYKIDLNSHSARQDILAYHAVLGYFMDLEAFTGAHQDVLGKENRRKYPRKDHHHAYRRRLDRAHEQLDGLATDLFAKMVDEAYWNHASKGMFWAEVTRQHEQYVAELRRNSYEPEARSIDMIVAEAELLERQGYTPGYNAG